MSTYNIPTKKKKMYQRRRIPYFMRRFFFTMYLLTYSPIRHLQLRKMISLERNRASGERVSLLFASGSGTTSNAFVIRPS